MDKPTCTHCGEDLTQCGALVVYGTGNAEGYIDEYGEIDWKNTHLIGVDGAMCATCLTELRMPHPAADPREKATTL